MHSLKCKSKHLLLVEEAAGLLVEELPKAMAEAQPDKEFTCRENPRQRLARAT